jgi:hypothetical protein
LRINLDLDLAAAALLDLFLVELDVFVLRLVDGRGAEFHGEILGSRRCSSADRERDAKRQLRQPKAYSHSILPGVAAS